MEYFLVQWVNDGKYVHWTRSHRPNPYTNVTTNNYIESWHDQLKIVYLNQRRNQRLDFLIFTLGNEVEEDVKREISRLSLNVGQMSKTERMHRKEEIKAEEPDGKDQ